MMKVKWCLIVLLLLAADVAFAQRMTVNVPLANVRSGPGTNYRVLWKIEKYHPVEVLKKNDGWCEIKDFEGDKGWVTENLLATFPSVIVKAAKCNVRSKPDLGSEIVFTVVKGVPFKVLDKKGQWLQVEHSDGDKGWISDSLVW